MRTLFLAFTVLFAAALQCSAQGQMLGDIVNQPAAATYTGPGDIVASATAWYGLRAYNAAYATGSNKSVNVRRASDNATQDIVILSTGALDIASANTFAGTDASCTGSMVGTKTLTISACSSGTLHVYDTLTAVGATGPFLITAIGTCASPPGTCTVNAVQTFASEAVTAQVALYITELYDQSGNSNPVLQGTAALQAILVPNCIGVLPCIGGHNWMAVYPYYVSTNKLSSALGSSFTAVASTNTPAALQIIITVYAYPEGIGIEFDGTGYPAAVSSNNSTATHLDSSVATGTYVLHSLVAAVAANPNAVINVDGTSTTGNAGTGFAATSFIFFMATNGDYAALSGPITEGGIWIGTTFNGTQVTNMCHNQYTYWGTATSC